MVGLPYTREYREWIQSELRFRLVACLILYAASIVVVAQCFQASLSFRIWDHVQGMFSLRSIAHSGIFAFSNTVLMAAISRTLTVDIRVENGLEAILQCGKSLKHVTVCVLYPVLASIAAWSFLELADGYKHISHGGDNDIAFSLSAVILFAETSALRSFAVQETLIRFPSLQCPRLMRIQSQLAGLVVSAGSTAGYFILFWYTSYNWLLGLVVPQFVRGPVGSVMESAFGNVLGRADPKAFDMTSSGGLFPIEIGAVMQTFVVLFCLGFCWQLGVVMLKIFSTETVGFDSFLLHGLTDHADHHRKYLAFSYLSEIAEFSAKDRECLYDQHPVYFPGQERGGSPWKVVSECLTGTLNELSKSLYEFMYNPARASQSKVTPSQRTASLFKDLQLHIWSAQTLSMLVSFSLEEDHLGVVQSSMTAILRALLDCSLAIEDYIGSSVFVKEKEAVALQGAQLARPSPIVLSTHLDNALYRIVTTFYDQLENFALPPRHAERLRAYVHFSK